MKTRRVVREKPYQDDIWSHSVLLDTYAALLPDGLGGVKRVGTPPVGHHCAWDPDRRKDDWMDFKRDAVEVVHDAHESARVTARWTMDVALQECWIRFAEACFPEVIELGVDVGNSLSVGIAAHAEVSLHIRIRHRPRR